MATYNDADIARLGNFRNECCPADLARNLTKSLDAWYNANEWHFADPWMHMTQGSINDLGFWIEDDFSKRRFPSVAWLKQLPPTFTFTDLQPVIALASAPPRVYWSGAGANGYDAAALNHLKALDQMQLSGKELQRLHDKAIETAARAMTDLNALTSSLVATRQAAFNAMNPSNKDTRGMKHRVDDIRRAMETWYKAFGPRVDQLGRDLAVIGGDLDVECGRFDSVFGYFPGGNWPA